MSVPGKGNRSRRPRLRAGAAVVFALSLMVSPAVHGEPVDRIVATINAEVITASELNCALTLNQRLGAAEKDRNTLEAETLDGLITRRLLVQEAHRLKFVEVSDQELAAGIGKLRERFSSDKEYNDFLARMDMTSQELSRLVEERLLVERFVEKKVGLFVRVSREEAETYFNEHTTDFKDKHFQDVQKKILAHLTERKLGQQLDQYLAELRGKADIRINLR
jgi:peptidyl-prolyl cis-trans isomerase SurA